MRLLIAGLLAALIFVPAASAEIMEAEGFASGGGMQWTWTASYDTQLNDLTFQCDLVSADTGQPVDPTPTMIATVTVIQANNQERSLDCRPIMNQGPQFDGNVNLKIASVGRWSGFFIRSSFRP